MHLLNLFSALSVILGVAYGARNVTVDDKDGAIVYSPALSWVRTAETPLNVGGSHMLTQDPRATATFKFTGVAVHFMSPLWPYRVSTAVSVDGGPAIVVSLVDSSRPDARTGPETVNSSIVWSAVGLENREHTLVVSVAVGEPFAIVDAFLVTQLTDGELSTAPVASSTGTGTPSASLTVLPPSSTQQTASTTSASTTSTSEPSTPTTEAETAGAASKIKVAPLVIGVLAGLGTIGIMIFALLRFIKERKRPLSEAWTAAGSSTARLGGVAKGRRDESVSRRSSSSAGRSRGGAEDDQEMMESYHPYGGVIMQNVQPTPFVDARTSPQVREFAQSPAEAYGTTGGYSTVPVPYPYALPAPVTVDPAARAPNRYTPGQSLSTITETSSPRTAKTPSTSHSTSNYGHALDSPSRYSPTSIHPPLPSPDGYVASGNGSMSRSRGQPGDWV